MTAKTQQQILIVKTIHLYWVITLFRVIRCYVHRSQAHYTCFSCSVLVLPLNILKFQGNSLKRQNMLGFSQLENYLCSETGNTQQPQHGGVGIDISCEIITKHGKKTIPVSRFVTKNRNCDNYRTSFFKLQSKPY